MRDHKTPVEIQRAALPTLQPGALPAPVLSQIRGALGAPFIAVIPNTTAALLTNQAALELPPGYIVILVFDPVDPRQNPLNWEDGLTYRIV